MPPPPPPPPAESPRAGTPSQPLIWIVVPLLSVFGVGCFIFFMWRRHRRARDPNAPGWADDRVIGPGGFLVPRATRPWASLGGSRSIEGLNELGEAPPPYEAKTPPPPPSPPVMYSAVALPAADPARGRPPGYCNVAPVNRDQDQQRERQEEQPEERHGEQQDEQQDEQREEQQAEKQNEQQEEKQEGELKDSQQQEQQHNHHKQSVPPPSTSPQPSSPQIPSLPSPPPAAHTTVPRHAIEND